MSWEMILRLISEINWHTIAFYIVSLLAISSAAYVVLTGNIVRSALALIFTFMMVAGIYLTLLAEFIAVVQVLIYAGAISVLIVFSIMLIVNREEDVRKSSPFSGNSFVGGIIAIAFFFLVSMIVTATSWNVTYQTKEFSDINLIARGFLNDHLVAFELAAVLLLIALVAAIFIVREARDDE